MANTSFYGLTGTTATVQNTIQASVDAAATSATNSATSETNSAASAADSLTSKNAAATSAAAALVSQNAAAGSASTAAGHVSSTAADAVATAADRVQTGLDRTAATTSAAAALVSENAAASDAAQVTTDAAQVASDKVQTAADRVATGQDVTASAASATSASNSASTATTQATNASNSASASATSATAAAASASSAGNDATQTAADRVQTGLDRTAAATSATDAATAKTAAETALDNFTDQYLGPQASVPSTDLDGDPLQTGSLVYDTTAGAMKIWNGSAWEAAYVTQSGSGTLLAANNLSDLSSASTGRINLGLGTASTTASTDYATAAQGTLAVSALQSGDNVSTLTNDSGYISSIPAQTFASLTGKPTTVAGYGITDAFDGAFSSLSGKPTTVAGYGITDAFDGAYGSLTGTPTIPTNNNQLTNGAGYVTSVPAQSFASLTGKPTTVSGYGITDVTSQFSAGTGISISGGTISSTVAATTSASALTSGTLPDGRFPATLPAASGVNLTSLNASNLSSGTIPDARFPAALPAISGANLTNLGGGFPSGTKMLFGQTAAPTGWTKITTNDDAALRIVSGTVGTGGSSGLSTALATPTVTGTIAGSTGAHTLTIAEMPSHSHDMWYNEGLYQYRYGPAGAYNNNNTRAFDAVLATGGGGSHSHSLSATFSGGTAAINVKYVDVIMASKD